MAQQPDLSPAGVLETPYLRAQAEWDGRIGSARVQARNWRLACFISLGLSLLSNVENHVLWAWSEIIGYASRKFSARSTGSALGQE